VFPHHVHSIKSSIARDFKGYINGPEDIYVRKNAVLGHGRFEIPPTASSDVLDHINKHDARDFGNITFNKAYFASRK
jgi:hypothetical protein